MRIIVGITGASGSVYAYSFIRVLAENGIDVHIICTDMGKRVMEHECEADYSNLSKYGTVYDNHDLFAGPASGSWKCDGMVIIPCSMNTLGSIANGMGDSLITRSASVVMKEGKKLITVIRETPYSIIHMENMLKLAKAGICIMPASPGFYNKPTQIWELVNMMIMKIMDQLNIEYKDAQRWGE